ncbi:uncharacterized membrane protein YcaP (DUF421 family) [Anaerosolibacter carboniphilus]|uniref:Uncharacterized membrane protein YcaP (DUF421 family) n=1 Tax=Anaerosolibacter carboniphilus TaxID=1417629 RepID=A0A841KWB3_9FIRM|nr:DUF421 domain-containing protein [Anaerosolibacter carboniphilus]MBB6217647.1 uncharacterized membrane protein YcaP (DUF421 family) [Anaerosolibacter carboniphilus]
MTTITEVFLQTILSFFTILFITRILGRQQVGQLTLFDYINGITFGSIAATVATDLNQRTWHHLLGLVLFGGLTFLMQYICVKNRRVSKVIQGEPIIVIQDGKILEKNLSRFHYTVDDLTHLLRKKDVFDINSVKYGILETTGEISVLKVASKEYVKAEDMNLQTKQESLPTEVIITGNIIYENLQRRGLTVKWLLDQLKMMNVKSMKEVFYATVDGDKRVYIDKEEDHFKKSEDITEEQR